MPNVAANPQVNRFLENISTLIGPQATAHDRFCVAVSGGPDSMALLWLAQQAFPGHVFAATVDHGLRTEARSEAEMVATYCAQHDIPHVILSPDVPITGNVQSAARAARYALMHTWCEEHGADWLLTAHHADDQMETLLMRLNRSSGVAGLAGVRARNGSTLRPLLGWRRSELAAIIAEQALPHVQDPSNEDTRFDRVRMREHLRDIVWLDPLAFARSADALADAQDALEWTIRELASQYVEEDGQGGMILARHDFPREVQRRLILYMLGRLDPDLESPRGVTLDQALVQLEAAKKAMIGDWLLIGGHSWSIKRAPPRSLV